MNNLLLATSTLGYTYNSASHTLTNDSDKQEKYALSIEQEVRYNKKSAKYLRFQSDNEKINYHGERIAFVLSDKNILGYARFHRSDVPCAKLGLPKIEESKTIALAFINHIAPDLKQNMKILWIKPHNEYIKPENEEICLTGMKVKCRDINTGLYFWVIIGANQQIMTFERDIQWITFPGKRGTEKWLDDAWVLENKPF